MPVSRNTQQTPFDQRMDALEHQLIDFINDIGVNLPDVPNEDRIQAQQHALALVDFINTIYNLWGLE